MSQASAHLAKSRLASLKKIAEQGQSLLTQANNQAAATANPLRPPLDEVASLRQEMFAKPELRPALERAVQEGERRLAEKVPKALAGIALGYRAVSQQVKSAGLVAQGRVECAGRLLHQGQRDNLQQLAGEAERRAHAIVGG
jgi:hypothetical protein